MAATWGWVYFALSANRTMAKIGFTTNPCVRAKSLKAYCKKMKQEFTIVGFTPGYGQRERTIRNTFREDLVWRCDVYPELGGQYVDYLYVTPQLLQYIDRLPLRPLSDFKKARRG